MTPTDTKDETDETSKPGDGYLEGQILVAMPGMPDPRFARTVIFMCAHSEDGAMGIVVNRAVDDITYSDLMRQLKIAGRGRSAGRRVHYGGPVETSRGFVLHSDDYKSEGTLAVKGGFALSSTVEVLRAIADDQGPSQSLLALGYAGWAPGQLDAEIQANGWLSVEADAELVLGAKLEDKWDRAIRKIGIDPFKLSVDSGHA
jgi:putative transcriptional regulator